MTEHLDTAARVIAGARGSDRALPPLDPAIRPRDEAEAYAVQARVHGLLASATGARIGTKIGCTTKVMQDYLGIHQPCHAGVFETGVRASGAVLTGRPHRVGIECELGVRLSADLSGDADADATLAAVGEVFAAIEIVEDRYVDWRATDAPTLIADDFFAAGCVLGEAVPRAEAGDLTTLRGTTRINGVDVGAGYGRDVMGHPAHALAWLAGSAAAAGRPLLAGDVVLTGSLVETRWLEPGDEAEIAIDRLGGVRLGLGSV